jgi:excinuclease ABC subunit C
MMEELGASGRLITGNNSIRWTESFEDFGQDPLFSDPSLRAYAPTLSRIDATSAADPLNEVPGKGQTHAACKQELKGLVQKYIPYSPGVYGILDSLNRLIYVGKSKALRSRLLSYFLPGATDEKAGQIIQHARSIVWELQPSEFAALLREQALIRTWQPRLNVVGMPNRSQPAYLNLGRGPAESFYVSRQWDTRATISRGPFYGSSKLYRAVEILNRYFLLRDCSAKTKMLFSNQLSLFDIPARAGCLRSELGNCLAPCLAETSRAKYQEHESHAKAWMQGESGAVHEELLKQMQWAVERLQFERAERLQQDAKVLRWLQGKLALMERATHNPPTLFHVPTTGNARFPKHGILYLLRSGGVEYAVAAPRVGGGNSDWRERILHSISRWYCGGDKVDVSVSFSRSYESLGLVTTWFQKNKPDRKRCVEILSGSDLTEYFRGVEAGGEGT